MCWLNDSILSYYNTSGWITTKGTVHAYQCTFFLSYLSHFFLEWEIFQTKFVDKIKTHILCSVRFFNPKTMLFVRKCQKILYSGAGHRWKYGASVLHAGYLRLQIHTLRLCNTNWFSTATNVARTRLNVTLYVHWLSYIRVSSDSFVQKRRI